MEATTTDFTFNVYKVKKAQQKPSFMTASQDLGINLKIFHLLIIQMRISWRGNCQGWCLLFILLTRTTTHSNYQWATLSSWSDRVWVNILRKMQKTYDIILSITKTRKDKKRPISKGAKKWLVHCLWRFCCRDKRKGQDKHLWYHHRYDLCCHSNRKDRLWNHINGCYEELFQVCRWDSLRRTPNNSYW